MFETLSKNSGRCNGAKPASDNRLRASDHSVPTRRPPLVPDREDHQFACRCPHQPSGPLRWDRQLHKIFFELSYQPKLSQMARLIDPVPHGEVPNARPLGFFPVLHAGHARMPSTTAQPSLLAVANNSQLHWAAI